MFLFYNYAIVKSASGLILLSNIISPDPHQMVYKSRNKNNANSTYIRILENKRKNNESDLWMSLLIVVLTLVSTQDYAV
jgi:hypothetical protein